jgi:bisphosphoglycerate-independent phosphoglycerate mutase (AlkP superfamily)
VAETSGNRDARMDRIEKALEMLIADHEQFPHDHKQLLIAQVLQKDETDQLLKVTREHTRQIEAERLARREETVALNKRVADLVGAIGNLISKIPAASLSS